MGMFDTYHPKERLLCPVCGARLRAWQGKEGPCLLLRWNEGVEAPAATVEEFSDVSDQRLPAEFHIYSCDCDCPFEVVARCGAENGVWSSTRLITVADVDAVFRLLPRARRSERKAWLREAEWP